MLVARRQDGPDELPQRDEDARVAGGVSAFAAERLLDRLGVAVRPRATVEAADLVGDRLGLAQQARRLGEGPGARPSASASANSSSTAAATCGRRGSRRPSASWRGARLPFDRLAEQQVQRRRPGATPRSVRVACWNWRVGSNHTARERSAIPTTTPRPGASIPPRRPGASRAGPRSSITMGPRSRCSDPSSTSGVDRAQRCSGVIAAQQRAASLPRAARGRGAARSGCRRRTSAARTGADPRGDARLAAAWCPPIHSTCRSVVHRASHPTTVRARGMAAVSVVVGVTRRTFTTCPASERMLLLVM